MSRPGPLLFLAAMALIGGACAKPRAVTGKKYIDVTVKCTDGKLDVNIKPYAVRLSKNANDAAEWRLDGNSSVEEISIENKTPGAPWPYTSKAPPYKVKKNEPFDTGPMQPDQAKGVFPYNVKVVCSFEDAPNREIVIDPDMIIID